MTANMDSGMRFGVVALNSLNDWIFDEFLEKGTNLSYEDAREEFESQFRAEYEGDCLETDLDIAMDDFNDSYHGEEDSYSLQTEGMTLELSYLGGAPLVWVIRSPHTTKARLCSPCCPNAGDLDNQDNDGVATYTLPDDWFLAR